MNILVSGGGITALATAINLGNRGHQVTLVERATHLRVNGPPIDIRGDSIEITERMGLLPQLRHRRVRMTAEAEFVDADGTPIAKVPTAEFDASTDDFEIAREDLLPILAGALPESTTLHFGESIDTLTDHGDGVDVRFTSGHSGRYDLVLGADGQHSAVRRLAFGPERDYLRHLGVYTAIADLPGEGGQHPASPLYNSPGLHAGIPRWKDRAIALFLFRSELLDYDYHDLDAQKKLLTEAFAGDHSWRIPELLDAAHNDPEFFFDSVSQIHMPRWHYGRVALLGDAAHCSAPFSGRGAALGLTGAYFLAEELERPSGDHRTAFACYESRQRPYVEFAQHSVDGVRDLLAPDTAEKIAERNRRLTAPA